MCKSVQRKMEVEKTKNKSEFNCLFLTLSRLKYWADFDEFQFRDRWNTADVYGQ